MKIWVKVLIWILVILIVIVASWFVLNPQVNCLETCKCMKECNEGGPNHIIPVESSKCQSNLINKICCCSGV